jgi:hypothetical protein
MDPISPEESLTRYIFQRNHFTPTIKRVKYAALLPPDDETSIYRISGFEESVIWDIGLRFVGKEQRGNPKARADLFASHVLNNGLDVLPIPEYTRDTPILSIGLKANQNG